MSKDAKRRSQVPDGLELSFILVALVVGFAALGFFSDRWLHTGPWLMIIGVLVGAALGFGYLVFILFAGSSKGGRKGGAEGEEDGSGKSSS